MCSYLKVDEGWINENNRTNVDTSSTFEWLRRECNGHSFADIADGAAEP